MAKVPQINPTTQGLRIPTVRQQINAPIEAFGGGNQGLAQVGLGLQAVGEGIEQYQKRKDEIEVKRSYISGSAAVQKYLHDPQEGVYNTRRGAYSVGVSGDTQKFLNDTYAKATENMNSRQKLVFDMQWARLTESTITNVNQFESNEFRATADDTDNKLSQQTAIEATQNMSAGQMGFTGEEGKYDRSQDGYTNDYKSRQVAIADSVAARNGWTTEQRDDYLNKRLKVMYTGMAQEMIANGEQYGISPKEAQAFMNEYSEYIDPKVGEKMQKQATDLAKDLSINTALDDTITTFTPEGQPVPSPESLDEALTYARKKYKNHPERDKILSQIRTAWGDFDNAYKQDMDNAWTEVQISHRQAKTYEQKQAILTQVKKSPFRELIPKYEKLIEADKIETSPQAQVDLIDAVLGGKSKEEIQAIADKYLLNDELSADDYEAYMKQAAKPVNEAKKAVFDVYNKQLKDAMEKGSNIIDIQGWGITDEEVDQDDYAKIMQTAYRMMNSSDVDATQVQKYFENLITDKKTEYAKKNLEQRIILENERLAPMIGRAGERRRDQIKAAAVERERERQAQLRRSQLQKKDMFNSDGTLKNLSTDSMSKPASKTVIRTTSDGRRIEFDAKTKKPIREIK